MLINMDLSKSLLTALRQLQKTLSPKQPFSMQMLLTHPLGQRLFQLYDKTLNWKAFFNDISQIKYTILHGFLPEQPNSEKQPLTIHYIGRQKYRDQLNIFFHKSKALHILRHESLDFWQYFQQSQQKQCPSDADLLFIEAFPGENVATHFYFTPYINALLPLETSIETQLAKISSKGHRRKIIDSLKEVQENNQVLSTQRLEDFEYFYHKLYLPFVKHRFTDHASIVPYSNMLKLYQQKGLLLFVARDNDPMASAALLYRSNREKETLYYWKYALAHVERLDPATFGEQNAKTEAAVLQYAIAEGYGALDFGATKAISHDGIFIHKKRLGCHFYKPNNAPLFRMMANPQSRARFFQHFPLLLWHDNDSSYWLGFEKPLTPKNQQKFLDTLKQGIINRTKEVNLFIQTNQKDHELLLKEVRQLEPELTCPVYVLQDAILHTPAFHTGSHKQH